jgi:general secretion pathway protein F
MPNFRYRALNDSGVLVNGSIVATSATEVSERIESLGLVLIESVPIAEKSAAGLLSLFNKPKPEDVSIFTRDLALILNAGARINDGLEMLASDRDLGRMHPIVLDLRTRVMGGQSFADALTPHATLFGGTYIALVRVGEAAGALDHVLEVLANERARSEALRRKVGDALRYPAFILVAAVCVLTFFLTYVLPQFASVLQDFGAKVDPVVATFLALSTALRSNTDVLAGVAAVVPTGGWLLLRRPTVRIALIGMISRLPLARSVTSYYRTGLFCRNLSLLLGSGVHLTSTLRILTDIMSTTGRPDIWRQAAERVRHGSKLSDALAEAEALPPMAVRMLRLGDETGQLAALAARVAEFYEAKLQRSLDRVVGIAGPAAIIVISIVVGGLIVSVMTALMSVTQMVN